MAIRNVLVMYNGTQNARKAVTTAADLARRHDAHLTGLFAHAMPVAYTPIGGYLPPDAVEMMQKHQKAAEVRVAAEFEELMAEQPGDLRWSYFTAQGLPNEVAAEYARTADLAVIGHPERDDDAFSTEAAPDVIALETGRPVLMVPAGAAAPGRTRGAVLAWDGKRSAARALADAMDLLAEADEITVLHVGRSEDEVRRPGRDVMEHLSRHGFTARLIVHPPGGGSIADVVLKTCVEQDAGLLVMGAYEHARLSEYLFGGVTRDVLARTKVPVLMSH